MSGNQQQVKEVNVTGKQVIQLITPSQTAKWFLHFAFCMIYDMLVNYRGSIGTDVVIII